MNSRTISRPFSFLSTLLLLCLVLVMSGPLQAETLKVGYTAISGSQAMLWVAREANIFRELGLEVDLVYLPGPRATQALIAGDISFAQVSSPPAVQAALAGADVVWVASSVNKVLQQIYSPPLIRTVADLKGKIFGVTRFGGVSDFMARYMLQNHGLAPDRDVKMLQVGGFPETLAALTEGMIHAGIFSAPLTLKARNAGLKELVNLASEGIPFNFIGLIATRSYLKNWRQAAKQFLKGYIGGIRKAKRDRDFTLGVISRYTKVQEPDLLDETYQKFIPYFEDQPYYTRSGMQFLLDQLARKNPRASSARPDDFVDMSLVHELDREVF